MTEIIKGAGLFLYPLLLCSLAASYIICERLFALRKQAVLPEDLAEAVTAGDDLEGAPTSVLGRVLMFYRQHRSDDDAVKAFARLEVNRMERGFAILDIIIGAAPLIGLLGTVTGLLQVFSNISPETGLPDQVRFTEGIALALTTTVLGLGIAIPSLVGSGYLQRRVETFAVELEALVQRLASRARKS